jgi:hypothetical protein
MCKLGLLFDAKEFAVAFDAATGDSSSAGSGSDRVQQRIGDVSQEQTDMAIELIAQIELQLDSE